MNHQDLQDGLRFLRLSTIAQDYTEIARQCEKERSTFEQYLAKLTAIELEAKRMAKVNRLLKACNLPRSKIVDDYNFTCRGGVTREQIARLSTGEFLKNGTNIVLYGEFGVGKSHLAEGLTRALCERGHRCLFTSAQKLINDLLEAQKNLTLASMFKKLDRFEIVTIDELGYSSHNRDGTDLFFQLISQRYERRSTMITTNLTYSEWDKLFSNPITTAAAVDRIIHRCETFNITGPSWRAEEAKKRQRQLKARGDDNKTLDTV